VHDKLHSDGDFTIYKVEVEIKYREGPTWQSWGMAFRDRREPDPPIRFASKKDMNRGRYREPYASYQASGECWQKTGIKGLLSFEKASAMVTELRAFRPELRFRIVEMKVSQHTRVVGTFEPVKESS